MEVYVSPQNHLQFVQNLISLSRPFGLICREFLSMCNSMQWLLASKKSFLIHAYMKLHLLKLSLTTTASTVLLIGYSGHIKFDKIKYPTWIAPTKLSHV